MKYQIGDQVASPTTGKMNTLTPHGWVESDKITAPAGNTAAGTETSTQAANPDPNQNLKDFVAGIAGGVDPRPMISASADYSPLSLAAKGAVMASNALGIPSVDIPMNPAGIAGAGTGGMVLGGSGGIAKAAPRILHGITHPLEVAKSMASGIGDLFTGAGADAIVSKAGVARGAQTAAKGERVLQGYMTPEELTAQGATIPKSGTMALNATTPEEMQAAKVQRWREDVTGSTTPEVAIGQKQAFTEMIKKEAGIDGTQNLTPVVVSNLIRDSGSQIGAINSARGPLPFGDSAKVMQDMIKLAPRDARGPLGSVIKDLAANAEANGGKITPDAFQYALTNASEIGAPGSSAERVMYANKITDHLHSLLQSNLTGPELEALKQARYQYKIGKTLQDGAAVGPDGLANPASFGNKWDKKIGQTLRGKDLLGRAADTFNFLASQQAHAGNTLERRFLPIVGKIRENPLAVTGGLGLGIGGGSLFR